MTLLRALKMKFLSSFALFSLLTVVARAFAPLTSADTTGCASSVRHSITRLFLSSPYNDDALARNKARTDVCNFLTQRAMQSFIHLLIETRDPHMVTWMEEFGGWTNLEEFHGTGALNLTIYPKWDSVLLEMMEQPPAVVVIRAKRRGKGHGGWSKNNPYLEERFVEFEMDVDPVSIASRIMAVREQLAMEWETDLDMLLAANDAILRSYSTRDGAFERTTMAYGDFGIFNARAPSPLRKGNYDLLVLLATQESVHRILRSYQQVEGFKVSFEWLRDFYADRIGDYFDGSGEYGRADDFLEQLLLTPPSVKQAVGQKADLIDPLKIAEDIIRTRSQVARDWKEVCRRIPKDHTELRKILLAKQMLKWGNAPNAESTEQVADEPGGIRKMGEFE
jgi:hypothetical protein